MSSYITLGCKSTME